MRPTPPVFLLLALLLTSTTKAAIVYLCECHWPPPYSVSSFADNIYLSVFPAVVYYDNTPGQNQAPAPQNIAVASPNLGPAIWGAPTSPASHQGFFFQTGQIFTIGRLNSVSSVGQVMGKAANSGGSWTCRKDTGLVLFQTGTMKCSKDVYCLPD